MSSLWTPDGEHPITPDPDPTTDDLSPEDKERAENLAREMAAVQEQIASTPASVVVSNHLMGFYELAAIHLSQEPPSLPEAALAIDALGAVVDKLPGRLGEAEATLRDALQQIRLAYVSIEKKSRSMETVDADDPTTA